MSVTATVHAAHPIPSAGPPPHTLTVTADGRYRLDCDGATDYCRSWVEADCAEAKPSDVWDGETWFDWEGEDTAHGVDHRYVVSLGAWAHPTDDCWLRSDQQQVAEVASDLHLPPGVYRVVHAYVGDEDAFTLSLAVTA